MSETDYLQKVDEYVEALKTGSDDERLKTKKALGGLLRQALVEVTFDRLMEIEKKINFAIYDCFVEGIQVAGLLLIDELIDIDYMEGALKTTRFANYLRGALPTEFPAQAELVATTLGKVAMEGGILASEVIEAELRRCVEWLAVVTSTTDSGNRRYSAILVIDELITHAPHIIATRLEVILAHISNGMRDTRPRAQLSCAHMLGSLLKLLNDRSLRTRDTHYARLYDDAIELLESSRAQVMTPVPAKPSTGHLKQRDMYEAAFRGGHLILKELYGVAPTKRHPRSTLLLARFSAVLGSILEDLTRCSKVASSSILETMAHLLAVMAKFHSEGFGHLYLEKAVDVFLAIWKGNPTNSIKASLLVMVGSMFRSVGTPEPLRLDPAKIAALTSILRAELASKVGCSAAAVLCVADLARSLPASEYEQDALQLITLALENVGVTSEVCDAVSQIGVVLTGVKDELHKRMLYTIRMILSPKEIAPLSAKGKKLQAPKKYTEKDVKLAIMMLSNVAAVAPERITMNRFWNNVVPYLTHESLDLRMTAVRITGELLRVTLQPSTDGVRSPIAGEVMEKLLAVGAADIDPKVRMTALAILPEELDDYLCRPTIIKMLVSCAYDFCDIEIQTTALKVLRRLSTKQPAMVLPPLRKLLVNVLNELSHPRDNTAHKQSAVMLGHIISSAPKLAHMYAVAIRDALLPKLKSNTAALKTEVMCTLNILASVGGKDMMSVDEVILVVLKALEEGKPSQQRRIACLLCLASLLRAVDWDVNPYERFPGLLSVLLRILLMPQPNPTAEDEIRGGVLKCLGVAGAYEPYRLRYQASKSKIRFDKRSIQVLSSLAPGRNVGETDLSPLIPSCGGEQLASHLSQYNPNLCIRVLLKVMGDSTLSSSNHKMAVGAIVMIVQRLDHKEYPVYLEKIYTAFLSSLNSTDDPSLLSFIIQQVRILSEIVGLHCRPYVEDIIASVNQLCDGRKKAESEILIQTLSLIVDLKNTFRESFLPYARKIVPVIGVALTQRKVITVTKALLAVEVLGSFLDGFMTILLPLIFKCFGEEQLRFIVHGKETKDVTTPTHHTQTGSPTTSGDRKRVNSSGNHPHPNDAPSDEKERINAFRIANRAIATIYALSFKMSLREFSAQILHSLLTVLTIDPAERPRTQSSPKSLTQSLTHHRTTSNEHESAKIHHHRTRQPSIEASIPREPSNESTRPETLSLIHQLEIETVHLLCGIIPNLRPEVKAAEGSIIRAVRAKNLDTDTFINVVVNRGSPVEKPPEVVQKKVLSDITGDMREFVCNPRALSAVVDVSTLTSAGEWIEWLRVLSIELIRESPSPAIRACANLAQVNLSVARQLFNAAFVSCYLYLPQPQKGHLLQAIIQAIKAPSIPPDVLQPLLSLAEFMEHMEVSEEQLNAKMKASQPASSFQRVESCQMAVSEVFSIVCSEVIEDEALAQSELLQGTPQGLFETTRADVVRPAAPPKPVKKPEFMHVAPPLPLPSEMDLNMLAEKAENCQMYAKALHYRELIFLDHLKREVGGLFGQYVDGYVVPFTPMQGMLEQGLVERTWKGWVAHVVKIVRLHQHLRNHHSAHGILAFALANFDRVVLADGLYIPKVEAYVYEELHQWDRAKEEWLLVLERLDAECAQNAVQQLDVRNGSSPRISSSRSYEMLKGASSTNELWSSGSPSGVSLTSSATPSLAQIAAGYKASKINCDRTQIIQGLIKACRSLGEWSEVMTLAQEIPNDNEVVNEIARAAWMLQEWDVLEKKTAMMDQDNVQTHIHEAVLAIQKNHLEDAAASVLTARKLVQPDIGALASESYSRAYPLIVKLQVIAELEEVVEWKQRGGIEAHEPDQIDSLLHMWKARLYATERRARYWEENLAIRRMLVPPQQQLDCWLKFVSIARKADKPVLATNTLKMLLDIDSEASIKDKILSVEPREKDSPHPLLVCAACEYLWHNDEKAAPQLLSDYLDRLSVARVDTTEYDTVKGKYYRKLGEWWQELYPDSYWLAPQRDIVMPFLQKATQYDSKTWKAWHRWALMNHRVMRRSMIRDKRIVPFVVHAAQGFAKVIQLGPSSSIQDLLRLLGLWFAHGHIKQVQSEMKKVFESIASNNWLLVIPQIVARLHHSNKAIKTLLQQLLVTLGKDHGQAIVYPLICVLCSEDPKRAQAGADVLDKISAYDPTLVAEGRIVATSLAKVALILAEQWSYGIDEARWLCFNEKDVNGAMKTFHGLHALMEAEPTSEHEILFHKQFSTQLSTAHAYMQAAEKYVGSGLDREKAVEAFRKSLDSALDIYSLVYKEIEKKLSKMPSLELAFANPDLSKAKHLSIAVPGTYRPTEPVVTIKSFSERCYIIPSKQRPRKISIYGSDGQEYVFLLKGREDLRQDERVMQLFTLINQLLNEDRTTAKLLVSIELYPVIPLASSAGLIGWLCNAETLYCIVKEYRKSHRLDIALEKSLIPEMVDPGGYDKLTLYQKVDVFEHILEKTTGDDLSRMLWLKSRSSEVWLSNRTTYTRSLAVMSMVGFVMGLGDRHPSNLMLDIDTRKVIHIDFGDCFEVASRRQKFPEQVPFRLTRLLIKAMDLAGVEGSFKKTSEDTMKVLRKHKDSLMSILSSFLHDPLINWRLIDPGKLRDAGGEETETWDPFNELLTQEETYSMNLGPSVDVELRHRSIREQAVRSVISRQNRGQCQQVVLRQAIGALNRIRQKLDGIAFKMKGEDGGRDHMYTFDYHDPLFVGEAVSLGDDCSICGECEVEDAVVRCDRCNDTFCIQCSDLVHSKRRNTGHTPHPLAAPTLPSLTPHQLALLTRLQAHARGYLSRRKHTPPPSEPPPSSDAGFQPIDAAEQVRLLIHEATAHENLAVAYAGWCPWW